MHKYFKYIFIVSIFILSPTRTFAYTLTTGADTSQDFTAVFYASNDTAKVSQTLLTIGSGDISSVTYRMKKSGSPTMNLTLTIYDTSGDLPTGSVLGTSNSVAATGLPSDCSTDVTFTFSSPVALSAASSYAFVLNSDAYSTTNNVTVCGSGASEYTDGRHGYYDGTWHLAGSQYDEYVTMDVSTGGGSSSSTTTSTSTPEEVQATGVLGILGLLSFISGLAFTLWLWTHFLG